MPQCASRLLGQLERGQLEFSVNHVGLSEFTRQLERMANRLALTMLLSAVVVSLGLLIKKPT